MSKRTALTCSAVCLCCLVLMGMTWGGSSANYAINWDLVGSSGGVISSASYVVSGYVGQAVIGPSSSAGYHLGAGFAYGLGAAGPPPARRLFLPGIMKDYGP